MRWGHVEPVRWADLAAGRVSERARRRMEAHAARCARCALAWDRVDTARRAMREVRDATGPELPWDTIRAKLRWDRSAASTTIGVPARRWVRPVAWSATAMAAAATVMLVTRRPHEDPGHVVRQPDGVVASRPATTAAQPLQGLVTRVSGVAQIDGERSLDALFGRALGSGVVLATAAGALDVQLGAGTALSLGPRSTLRVERLDTGAVELSIEGVVDLEVAPRRAGQRFMVRAGAHTVEVRGTRFRVEHRADATRVWCRHGLVSVRDGASAIEVGAGQAAALRTAEAPVASQLGERELIELAVASPYQVPWDRVESLLESSARLDVSAAGDQRVRVDGLELGRGSFAVRALRGRHLVELAERGGAFRRAGWAEVGAGVRHVQFSSPESGPSQAPAARAARSDELRRALDHRGLGRCVRAIAKQGVADMFVAVELEVGRDGAIGYLNIIDTDLPVEVAECVRSSLAAISFRPGPPARLRERIDL